MQITNKTKFLYKRQKKQLTKPHVFKAYKFNPRRQLLQPVHLNQCNRNGKEPKFHVSKLQSFYFETFTINIIIIKTKQLLFYFNKIK